VKGIEQHFEIDGLLCVSVRRNLLFRAPLPQLFLHQQQCINVDVLKAKLISAELSSLVFNGSSAVIRRN
jgi:hypothetical protein